MGRIHYIIPLFSFLPAAFFGRFLGSEGSAIITGKFVILFAIILFGFIFLFRFYSGRLKDKYGFPLIIILYGFLFVGISFLGSLIRIYVFSHVGLDLTTLFPLVLSVGAGQGLPEQSPPDPSSESSWSGSWIEKWMNPEVGSSAPNLGGQPREDEASSQPTGVAGPSNAGPSAQDPGEDAGPSSIRRRVDSGPDSGSGPQYLNVSSDTEGRAAEHFRISRAVEAITKACEKEEASMIHKAHVLLQGKGVVLEDPSDVERALGIALYDSWQCDIDDRLPHFRRLRRDFGTGNCSIWNQFIDELNSLGNPQATARHKVD